MIVISTLAMILCLNANSQNAGSFTYSNLQSSINNQLVLSKGIIAISNDQATKIQSRTLKLVLNTGTIHKLATLNTSPSSTWSVSLGLNVSAYDASGNVISGYNQLPVSLSINQDQPSTSNLVEYKFINSQIASFKITEVKFASTGSILNIQNDVKLDVSYEDKIGKSILDINGTEININTFSVSPCTGCSGTNLSKVIFNWSTSSSTQTFDSYDIQILKLEPNFIASCDVDWNKAATIEVIGTSYEMTLAEGTGFYLWRVRPIGNYYDGGRSEKRNLGAWSYDADRVTYQLGVGTLYSLNAADKIPQPSVSSKDVNSGTVNGNLFYYTQFDDDKNFIYNKVLTEGSRQAETITYANGLNQVNQTQTKIFSTQEVLGTQTVYDYSGRPVMKTMVAPVGSNQLGYKQDFLSKSNFTSSDFDDDATIMLPNISKIDGKINDYYSSSNPDNKIPDAKQYPFARTFFYNNATGRVFSQSSPGENFKLSDAADSKNPQFFYEAVTQSELNTIFGKDEAPKDTTVYKVISIDPNKVTSVKYIAKTGQILATCLDNATTSNNLEIVGNEKSIPVNNILYKGTLNQQTLISTNSTSLNVIEPSQTISLDYVLKPTQIPIGCSESTLSLSPTYRVVVEIEDIQNPDATESISKLIDHELTDVELKSSIYHISKSVTLYKGSYQIQKKIYLNNISSTTNQTALDNIKTILSQDAEKWTISTNCCGPLTIDLSQYDCNNVNPICASGSLNKTALVKMLKADIVNEQSSNYKTKILFKNLLSNNYYNTSDDDAALNALIDKIQLSLGLTCEQFANCYISASNQLTENISLANTEKSVCRSESDPTAEDVSAQENVITYDGTFDLLSAFFDCLGYQQNGLTGYYYKNYNYNATAKVSDLGSGTLVYKHLDPAVNFTWKDLQNGPSNSDGFNNNSFAIDWKGSILVPSKIKYYFKIISNDGVRVYVNGIPLSLTYSSNTYTSNSAVELKQGYNKIEIEYYNYLNASHTNLFPGYINSFQWKKEAVNPDGTSDDFSDVPLTSLFPEGQECKQYKAVMVGLADELLQTDLDNVNTDVNLNLQNVYYLQVNSSSTDFTKISGTDDEKKQKVLNMSQNYSCLSTYFYNYDLSLPYLLTTSNLSPSVDNYLTAVQNVCECKNSMQTPNNSTPNDDAFQAEITACIKQCETKKEGFTDAIKDDYNALGQGALLTTGTVDCIAERAEKQCKQQCMMPHRSSVNLSLLQDPNSREVKISYMQYLQSERFYEYQKTDDIQFKQAYLQSAEFAPVGSYVNGGEPEYVYNQIQEKINADLEKAFTKKFSSGTVGDNLNIYPLSNDVISSTSMYSYSQYVGNYKMFTTDDKTASKDLSSVVTLVWDKSSNTFVKCRVALYCNDGSSNHELVACEINTLKDVAWNTSVLPITQFFSISVSDKGLIYLNYDQSTSYLTTGTPYLTTGYINSVLTTSSNSSLVITLPTTPASTTDYLNIMVISPDGINTLTSQPISWQYSPPTGINQDVATALAIANAINNSSEYDYIFAQANTTVSPCTVTLSVNKNNWNDNISLLSFSIDNSTSTRTSTMRANLNGDKFTLPSTQDLQTLLYNSTCPNTTSTSTCPYGYMPPINDYNPPTYSPNYKGVAAAQNDYTIENKFSILSNNKYGGEWFDQIQSNGCFRLTPGNSKYLNTVAGSYLPHTSAIWNKTPIDLSKSFDMSFNAFFGCAKGHGADGMAFVLQNYGLDALGGQGGNLGYIDMAGNHLGIEFDTYNNAPLNFDIQQHHISIISTNSSNPQLGSSTISAKLDGSFIDDCDQHTIRVVWSGAPNNILEVYFDGNLRQRVINDIINNVFSRNSSVYWGWTGGEQGGKNEQWICPIGMPTNMVSNCNNYSNSCSTPAPPTCDFCMRWKDHNVQQLASQLNTKDLSDVTCEEMKQEYIANKTEKYLNDCLESRYENIKSDYLQTCAKGLKDSLSISYNLGYHQFTLYYYDRAGNLIKTVPPQGVDLVAQNHTYQTTYNYNSVGHLLSKNTPDDGTTNYRYNAVGQLVLSQNSKQITNNKFSYTKYDNLGRIIESGEFQSIGSTPYTIDKLLDDYAWSNNSFPDGVENITITDVTNSVYTTPADDISYFGQPQSFLLNRISQTYNSSGIKTYYSYDPHGNVQWIIQEIPEIGRKTIRYEYDLISGKVLNVYLNEQTPEQFIHKYEYDEDNRITKVYTSKDGIIWDKDANYLYYLHGPLKRTEIGQDNIQGVDYIYTLEGYLKSINQVSLDPTKDPGNDGASGSDFVKDEFAMELGYYNGDFNRTGLEIGTNNTLLAQPLNSQKDLYNGNIASWSSNIRSESSKITNGYGLTTNLYSYDKLNRLKKVVFNNYSSSAWMSDGRYNEAFTYDYNGNILNLCRNSFMPGDINSPNMDSLTYHYQTIEKLFSINTNRLLSVTDFDITSAGLNDIQNGQIFKPGSTNNNYVYDNIGNLIQDKNENIKITWNYMNKVESVTKYIGAPIPLVYYVLKYTYDATGNRATKQTLDATGNETSKTYYLRDATGNIMSVYERTPTTTPNVYNYKLIEQPIYGSSRLGENKPNITVSPNAGFTTIPTPTPDNTNIIIDDFDGNRNYQIASNSGWNSLANNPKTDYINSSAKVLKHIRGFDTYDYIVYKIPIGVDYSKGVFKVDVYYNDNGIFPVDFSAVLTSSTLYNYSSWPAGIYADGTTPLSKKGVWQTLTFKFENIRQAIEAQQSDRITLHFAPTNINYRYKVVYIDNIRFESSTDDVVIDNFEVRRNFKDISPVISNAYSQNIVNPKPSLVNNSTLCGALQMDNINATQSIIYTLGNPVNLASGKILVDVFNTCNSPVDVSLVPLISATTTDELIKNGNYAAVTTKTNNWETLELDPVNLSGAAGEQLQNISWVMLKLTPEKTCTTAVNIDNIRVSRNMNTQQHWIVSTQVANQIIPTKLQTVIYDGEVNSNQVGSYSGSSGGNGDTDNGLICPENPSSKCRWYVRSANAWDAITYAIPNSDISKATFKLDVYDENAPTPIVLVANQTGTSTGGNAAYALYYATTSKNGWNNLTFEQGIVKNADIGKTVNQLVIQIDGGNQLSTKKYKYFRLDNFGYNINSTETESQNIINGQSVAYNNLNPYLDNSAAMADNIIMGSNVSIAENDQKQEAFRLMTGKISNAGFKVPVNGLKATYYYNNDFTNPARVVIDSTINFAWGNSAPLHDNSYQYSVAWEGYVYIPVAGTYTLNLMVQGAAGNISFNGNSSNNLITATINTPGFYPINVSIQKPKGGYVNGIKLSWATPNTSIFKTIPQCYLFETIPQSLNNINSIASILNGSVLKNGFGLKAIYYSNITFSGTPTFIDIVPNVNFNYPSTSPSTVIVANPDYISWLPTSYDWGINLPYISKTITHSAPPIINFPYENYSVRYNGTIIIPKDGNYTFYAISDDGFEMWIDNKYLSSLSYTQYSPNERQQTLFLTKGAHIIKIQYTQNTGPALARLSWSSPEIKKQVIPYYAFSTRSDYVDQKDYAEGSDISWLQGKQTSGALTSNTYKIDVNGQSIVAKLPASTDRHLLISANSGSIYWSEIFGNSTSTNVSTGKYNNLLLDAADGKALNYLPSLGQYGFAVYNQFGSLTNNKLFVATNVGSQIKLYSFDILSYDKGQISKGTLIATFPDPAIGGVGLYTNHLRLTGIQIAPNGSQLALMLTVPLLTDDVTKTSNRLVLYNINSTDASLTLAGDFVLSKDNRTSWNAVTSNPFNDYKKPVLGFDYSPDGNYIYYMQGNLNSYTTNYNQYIPLKFNKVDVSTGFAFTEEVANYKAQTVAAQVRRGSDDKMYIAFSNTTGKMIGWQHVNKGESPEPVELTLNHGICAIGLPLQPYRSYNSPRPAPFGNIQLQTTATREIGKKTYELTDHLGNIRTTFTDRRIANLSLSGNVVTDFSTDITSISSYYAFGMQMPGRTFSPSGYRFGYNGKENDNEIEGNGNSQDYGMRQYDTRLGRFFSPDPLIVSEQKYPWYSPYQFAGNKPIKCIDLDGLEEWTNDNGSTTAQGDGPRGSLSGPLTDDNAKENGYTQYGLLSDGRISPSKLKTSDFMIEYIKKEEVFKRHMYDNDGGMQTFSYTSKQNGTLITKPVGHSGNVTIGYGHLIHLGPFVPKNALSILIPNFTIKMTILEMRAAEARFINGIDKMEGLNLLTDDVKNKGENVVKFFGNGKPLLKVSVTQNQFDAMVDLAFNHGNANKVISLLNQGSLNEAGEMFKNIVGDASRRLYESNLFLTPVLKSIVWKKIGEN